MSENQTIRKEIESGAILVGNWVSLPYSLNVEILAAGPADFLLVDGEHGPIAPDMLHGLLASAELRGKPVVFRVRQHGAADIKAALDSGVHTIMIPMVDTPEQAKELVAAAKYPPLGRRGNGPWRASRFYQNYADYLLSANEEIALIVQIESQTGLNNAAAIAAVPGVDMLYVGPADLSAALGLPLGAVEGELLAACRSIAAAAKAHGKTAGIDVTSLAYVPQLIDAGFTLFTYGSDIAFLQTGSQQTISEFRGATEAALNRRLEATV